jgi:hypothetical protein
VLLTRKRPRKERVRREPIDLEQLAAEFAELPEPDEAFEPVECESDEPRIDEHEILVALQAEVQRVQAARVTAEPAREIEPEPEPEPVAADPFGIVSEPVVVHDTPAGRVGLPLDQVRAWLEHVQEDLQRIQSRLAYLEAEQTRLQEQHHIVAELLSSSTPV